MVELLVEESPILKEFPLFGGVQKYLVYRSTSLEEHYLILGTTTFVDPLASKYYWTHIYGLDT